MTDSDLAELLRHCPTLFHMAQRGSWPGIQRHGLRSTTALLDLFEVSGPQRTEIEETRRPESVALSHPVHGDAMVRDQKPMTDGALQRCLQGPFRAARDRGARDGGGADAVRTGGRRKPVNSQSDP